jgi:hypothetical protein
MTFVNTHRGCVQWRRLHLAFSEPELVELGYSIAITLGQRHWRATHGVVERL